MSDTRAIKPEPFWLIAAGLVAADQILKIMSEALRTPIELGPVSLTRELNQVGVFGLAVGNAALIVIGLVVVAVLLVMLLAGAYRRPVRLGLWLILGGAASNLIDRIVHGGVVDVISIADTSRFNLADAMIVLGALSLVRSVWWRE